MNHLQSPSPRLFKSVEDNDTTINGLPFLPGVDTCFTLGKSYRIFVLFCAGFSMGLISSNRNPKRCFAAGMFTLNVGLAAVTTENGGMNSVPLAPNGAFDFTDFGVRLFGISSIDNEVGQNRARRLASNVPSTEMSSCSDIMKLLTSLRDFCEKSLKNLEKHGFSELL